MKFTGNNIYLLLLSIILFERSAVEGSDTTTTTQNVTASLTNIVFKCQNKGHYCKTITNNQLDKTELTTLWRVLYEIQQILTDFHCYQAA
ncbi:unnamed protein product [Schistosoma rodhaini]|uniref:Uncharacterized protein n=1 Tax=Schistosoma mansoni TaxID=6183 RepID=G4VPW5_SCHMA|nr:hypothetical protein Smp_093110 [Schistosoma mansoni]CAH8655462.1 unnamed protein product [Schistosoma rodhaini]|eukprot:XP_018653949.1 hypothetical protein Smp_093110 [Schistosoma mansoni]